MTQVFVGGSSFEIDFRQFDKKFTGFVRSLMGSRNKSVENLSLTYIEQLSLESRYMDRVVMTAITNRFAWKCYCFQVVPKTECLRWLPLSFCERGAIELKVCERQIGKNGIFRLKFHEDFNAFEELMGIYLNFVVSWYLVNSIFRLRLNVSL